MISQEGMPPGQLSQGSLRAHRDTKLASDKSTYNDKLIIKNNLHNGDEGVRAVLFALDKENPIKALTKTKKDPLLATLRFLNSLGYKASKQRYKGVLVEELKTRILDKYDMDSP